MLQEKARIRKLTGIRILLAGVDANLVVAALLVAAWLSQGGAEPGNGIGGDWMGGLPAAPFQGLDRSGLPYLAAAVLSVPVFAVFGFYTQLWRYASLPQYISLAGGAAASALLLALAAWLAGYPLSAACALVYWMALVLGLMAFRLSMRGLAGLVRRRRSCAVASGRDRARAGPDRQNSGRIRVMIIGAGYAGSQIIRELGETGSERTPVVLIDDDPGKHGQRIHQVPVVGGRQQIEPALVRHRIDEMILAITDAPRQLISELVAISSRTGCRLKILPKLSDLISGRVGIDSIKKVDIEDLLGRSEVVLNTAEIAGYLENEVVLVTGGGGSIGSELCRQIAGFRPRRLILFDIYENNAYQLQQELLYRDPSLDLVVLIGSVRDSERLDEVMCRYQPGVVFHAAAHKHVPLMQDSPGEAVKNNVFGTWQTALIAGRRRVRRFVLISTDKAVNPTSIMGATKRLAELTLQGLSRQFPQTTFAAVRFGNVLGSSGSVIPLFQQQIRTSRQITVTHPEIRRYFMTIPEAAQLVIQAGALVSSGEICVLDMGESVRIVDLARDLIRLSGLEPDVDVEIVYTGLRPGEKLFEELKLDLENLSRTVHNKIFVLRPVLDDRETDAEINRLASLIGWSSHALRQHLAWLRSILAQSAPPVERPAVSSGVTRRDLKPFTQKQPVSQIIQQPWPEREAL